MAQEKFDCEELLMFFSDSFFKDVKSASEPIEFDDKGNQLVDENLRQAHCTIFNFLNYLAEIVKYSKTLELPLDKTVALMYNGHLKRLGWVKEYEHLCKLKELFRREE